MQTQKHLQKGYSFLIPIYLFGLVMGIWFPEGTYASDENGVTNRISLWAAPIGRLPEVTDTIPYSNDAQKANVIPQGIASGSFPADDGPFLIEGRYWKIP